jgi:hypothetical protein
MALPTLLDLAILNGSDMVAGLVDEATRQTPELTGKVNFRGKTIQVPMVGASRTIKGRTYKTLIRTGLPTAGFRDANQGVAASKSTHQNKNVETFILNARWEADKAVADSHEDGPQAYIAMEAEAVTAAAFMALAKQFYYGRANGGHAKGHPGLIDSVDPSMVVDATGTTASTGSSVWGVKWGAKFVQWVLGENGSLETGDVREESVPDEAGNRFTAYVQELLGYPGLQVLNKFAIGRIRNLTADANKGLTDKLMGSLVAKYPAGYVPDCFFLSRRSLEQLRASRTATNATGAEAPTPTEYEGIPLIPTDSIVDTESLD